MSYLTYPIIGGLGNQLFVIAAAFHMRNLTGAQLVLLRNVEMNSHSTGWDEFYNECPLLEAVLAHSLPQVSWRHYGKTRFSSEYEDRMEMIKQNAKQGISTINEGYFQHLRYLPDISFVRRLFNISHKQEQVRAKLSNIDFDTTCAIHFRLGDYKGITNVFLLLPDSYYQDAISKVTRERPGIKTLLVFHELGDRETVESRMKTICNETYEVIYSPTLRLKDWEEMIAISLCRGIIIANSTFSWWGAYFSLDSTVVYPPYWHHDQGEFPEHGLALSGWIKGS